VIRNTRCEHLGFVFEASECTGMHDAIAVALEGIPVGVG